MAGQIAHGLLNDANHMVELFRVAAATDAELVNVTMNSISGSPIKESALLLAWLTSA